VINRADAAIEDKPPGLIVQVNSGDVDADGVTDWADGYNRDGVAGNADDRLPASSDSMFVPVQISVSPLLDLNVATFRLTYDASDPAGVTSFWGVYFLPGGSLRLWTKTASQARNAASVYAGAAGDFVPATAGGGMQPAADWAKLGITAANRTVTLYMEA